jgi:hypothetical protein
VKKVIDTLNAVAGIINGAIQDEDDPLITGLELLNDAIAELKAPPRWETPEQYEKRTGEAWLDNWAVYYRQKEHGTWSGWIVVKYSFAQRGLEDTEHVIVCATEAGPPPDGWMPE